METKQKTMNTKHTPGPWIKQFDYVMEICEIVNEKGNLIAAVFDAGVEGQDEANHSLIAAAPELLEALTELHKVVMQSKDTTIFDNGINTETVAKAFSVIQKATQ